MANKRRSDYTDGGDRPWNDTARRPSDEELVRTVLEVDDPRTLANRVDRIPLDVKAVHIEQVYKCSEKLPCAVPSCPALHNKGLIVRLSNEQVAHIGHICGEKLFPGEGNWDQQMATLNWKIKRQNYLKRIAPLERNIIACLKILQSWQRPFKEFRDFRSHFRENFIELYNELRNAVRSNGALQVPRRRRNRLAEEMRGKQKGKNDRPIYENYLETYGQLQGARIFHHPGPSSILKQAEDELLQVRVRLGAKSLRNEEMNDLLQRVRRVADKLEEAHAIYVAMADFTKNDHLRLLSRFAKDHPQIAARQHIGHVESAKEEDYDLVRWLGWFEIEQLDLSAIDLLRGTRAEQRDVA